MKYTNSEIFELPSKGKIYGSGINPQVELRSMTTLDEMKRQAPAEYQYKKMARLIEDCMLSKLEVPVYDLCIGDFQYLVHKLRIISYGPEYKLALRCPICNNIFKTTLNLDELKVRPYTEEYDSLKKVHLPQSNKDVELRVQTPRILDEVVAESKERNKKYRDNLEEGDYLLDYSYLITLKSLIKTVDGEPLSAPQLEQLVTTLPVKDANVLLQKADKLNNFIGIDTLTHITCPECNNVIDYSFRIDNSGEFWGPSVD